MAVQFAPTSIYLESYGEYMSKEELGRDLKLVELDLGYDLASSPRGDLTTIGESYNLAQAIILRLMTMEGELTDLGLSSYGSRLHELIGELNNENTRQMARNYAYECVSQDSRIRRIVDISVETVKREPNRIDIFITVEPVGRGELVEIMYPFSFEVES